MSCIHSGDANVKLFLHKLTLTSYAHSFVNELEEPYRITEKLIVPSVFKIATDLLKICKNILVSSFLYTV